MAGKVHYIRNGGYCGSESNMRAQPAKGNLSEDSKVLSTSQKRNLNRQNQENQSVKTCFKRCPI